METQKIIVNAETTLDRGIETLKRQFSHAITATAVMVEHEGQERLAVELEIVHGIDIEKVKTEIRAAGLEILKNAEYSDTGPTSF